MLARHIHVIKKNQVQKGPPFQLPLGKTPASVKTGPGQSPDGTEGAAQARIVESNSDYVILEMLCSCGRKSFVQCNYGNVAGSQELQETRP